MEDQQGAETSAALSAEGDGDRSIIRKSRTRFSSKKMLTVDCRSHLIEDLIQEEIDPVKATSGTAQPRQHPAAAVQTPGMVLSVWGCESSAASKFEPYFSQKAINFDGELSEMQHFVGLMSHRGLKPDMPNQDDFFVLAREETLLFGVLDGHGPEGHQIAHFAQEHLPTLVTEHVRSASSSTPAAWAEAVTTAFSDLKCKLGQELQQESHYSGTTATMLMLDRAAQPAEAETGGLLRLRCAYLGDSIAVAAKRRSQDEPWDTTMLTDIHRPERPDEAARIYEMGGSISGGEPDSPTTGAGRLVTPEWHLAMSRSVGDVHAIAYGLSPEPEFAQEYVLEADFEHLILVCSDGVWDVIPPAQAVQLVGRYQPSDAQMAVDKLVAKAQLRWQELGNVVDDITAVLVWPTM